MVGDQIYELCKELFPINRSLTGDGVRETLSILRRELPGLNIMSMPSGSRCFDWTVPKEWNVREAYIVCPNGEKICDFSLNNLHLVGYSIPIHETVDLEVLQEHLHSLPELPDAIPYVTSYYKEKWGFCISQQERDRLKPGSYTVHIDSKLEDGELNYAELLIKGDSDEEIFLSSYICHPSMGNNELSGPTVLTYLTKYIMSMANRRYSYRIVFIPETIGSIVYLSKNLVVMKERIVAGFNLSCVGDNNAYSFLPSRNENTLADRVALHVLQHFVDEFVEYSFADDRGSDERQYCAPGIDLPVCSIMRSKYAEYDEYHTSLDNLDFISAEGLDGAYQAYVKVFDVLESNFTYKINVLCEPQLGSRGLYPQESTKDTWGIVKNMMNICAYADGTKDLVAIADKISIPAWDLIDIVSKFKKSKLLEKV